MVCIVFEQRIVKASGEVKTTNSNPIGKGLLI